MVNEAASSIDLEVTEQQSVIGLNPTGFNFFVSMGSTSQPQTFGGQVQTGARHTSGPQKPQNGHKAESLASPSSL